MSCASTRFSQAYFEINEQGFIWKIILLIYLQILMFEYLIPCQNGFPLVFHKKRLPNLIIRVRYNTVFADADGYLGGWLDWRWVQGRPAVYAATYHHLQAKKVWLLEAGGHLYHAWNCLLERQPILAEIRSWSTTITCSENHIYFSAVWPNQPCPPWRHHTHPRSPQWRAAET